MWPNLLILLEGSSLPCPSPYLTTQLMPDYILHPTKYFTLHCTQVQFYFYLGDLYACIYIYIYIYIFIYI